MTHTTYRNALKRKIFRTIALTSAGAALVMYLPFVTGCGCGTNKNATDPSSPSLSGTTAASPPMTLTPQSQTPTAPGVVTAPQASQVQVSSPGAPGQIYQQPAMRSYQASGQPSGSSTQSYQPQATSAPSYQTPSPQTTISQQATGAPATGQSASSSAVLAPNAPDADGKVLMPDLPK